jgi:MFS family permease
VDAGIFVLHAAVTGLFVVVPFLLQGLVRTLDLWRVYAPVLLIGMVAMVIASRQADRPRRGRWILRGGGALVVLGLVALAVYHRSALAITLGLTLFVAGFASIEPVLASLLTRFTGKGARGTAAGVFNMVQFSGAFLGGALAGLVLPLGHGAPLLLAAAFVLAWWCAIGIMRDPDDVMATVLHVPRLDADNWPRVRRALLAHPAVLEAEWTGGDSPTVRHWADRASAGQLEGLAESVTDGGHAS